MINTVVRICDEISSPGVVNEFKGLVFRTIKSIAISFGLKNSDAFNKKAIRGSTVMAAERGFWLLRLHRLNGGIDLIVRSTRRASRVGIVCRARPSDRVRVRNIAGPPECASSVAAT